MCLAVPGQVLNFSETVAGMKMATVSFGGIEKSVCIDFVPDVKVGNYVLVHVGFALNIVDEEEAEETIKLINEIIEAG